MLLNGFSPVVSYAYESNDNFYPIDSSLDIYINRNGYDSLNLQSRVSSDGKYYLDNEQLYNVYEIIIYTLSSGENLSAEWTFPYNKDNYDYYLLGTLTGYCMDDSLSTFKPTYVAPSYYDINSGNSYAYNVYDTNIYDIDSYAYRGFGFYERVDFASADNIGIRHITFNGDIHGNGNKPANLTLELGIMAIEKGTSEEVVLSKILAQLEKMEVSINNSINDAANDITNSIENQYTVSEEENFGVDDIVDQVNQKAGVLSFGTDTLVNFLDLFDAANATNTQLTFPGFSMEVQGVTYQVWPDYHYDLSELETQFGALIEVVRWGCVMAVWLAVLNYLVKAYDSIFGR